MKIQIKDLKIVNRGRKDYGDLMEMSNSIKKYGLINPILVQPITDERYKYELIAGERRTKASILAGCLEIEATTRENCSAILKKEYELEENIQRKELLWSEQCQMMLMLDDLKRKEHDSPVEIKSGNRHTGELSWGIKDTALALNKSVGTVAQDLKLARAMKDNPKLAMELQRLPKVAAFKKLQSIEENQRLQRLYKDKVIDSTDAIQHGSCLDLIKNLKNESVDLIVTDPPFAVAKINEAKGTYNDLRKEDDNSNEATMHDLYEKLVPEMYRVLKPGGHIYMFFGNEWYPFLVDVFKRNAFILDPVPLIWNKGRTTTPFRGNNYQQCYEPILFIQKSAPDFRRLEKPSSNILNFSIVSQKEKRHVFHKPANLIEFLITQSSMMGQTVLDPFSGSGQTVKSALKLKRKGIGFELSKEHYLKSLEYIKSEGVE